MCDTFALKCFSPVVNISQYTFQLEQEAKTYLTNCPKQGILATYEVYHTVKQFLPIAEQVKPRYDVSSKQCACIIVL